MIINGTNDPYWTVDSLNLYWDGLKCDRWVLYVPNAGHDLLEKKDGKKQLLPERAVNALVAFSKHILKDNPMPKLEWKHDDEDGQARLTVKSDPIALGARVWVSHSKTRDFRPSTWEARDLEMKNGQVVTKIDLPKTGYTAFFGELDFSIDGVRHQLSTQVRVLQAKEP
jgi:PhoPQ-activated pathogenicity-related protein